MQNKIEISQAQVTKLIKNKKLTLLEMEETSHTKQKRSEKESDVEYDILQWFP